MPQRSTPLTPFLLSLFLLASCGLFEGDDDEDSNGIDLSAFVSDARVTALVTGLKKVKIDTQDVVLDSSGLFTSKVTTNKDGVEISKTTATREGNKRTEVETKPKVEATADNPFAQDESKVTRTFTLNANSLPNEIVEVEEKGGSTTTKKVVITYGVPNFFWLETKRTTTNERTSEGTTSTETEEVETTYGTNGVPAYVESSTKETKDGVVRSESSESCEGLVCTRIQKEAVLSTDPAPQERQRTVTTFAGAYDGIPVRVEITQGGKTWVSEAQFKDGQFNGSVYSGESLEEFWRPGSEVVPRTVTGGCTFEAPDILNCTRTDTAANGTVRLQKTSKTQLVVISLGQSTLIADFVLSERTEKKDKDGQPSGFIDQRITYDDKLRPTSFQTAFKDDGKFTTVAVEYDGDSRRFSKITTTDGDGALIQTEVFTY